MSPQPAKSSLKTQVERADSVYAAELLDAKGAELDKREALIAETLAQKEAKDVALDAQIAHKKALLVNLENQAISARNATGIAENEARKKIARLETDATVIEQKLSTVSAKLSTGSEQAEILEERLTALREQISESSETVLSLENKIIDLKQQAQIEQTTNKQAIDELSATVSDLLDQQHAIERSIAERRETLKRLEIKVENATIQHSLSKDKLNAEIEELAKRSEVLAGNITSQEAKLNAVINEQTHRATLNLTRDRELQAKEDRLNEWAKELGYKERKVQSDLSLR